LKLNPTAKFLLVAGMQEDEPKEIDESLILEVQHRMNKLRSFINDKSSSPKSTQKEELLFESKIVTI
jgi:hypothetical protein